MHFNNKINSKAISEDGSKLGLMTLWGQVKVVHAFGMKFPDFANEKDKEKGEEKKRG